MGWYQAGRSSAKKTAVENLLKSKYLTNGEVENISPVCLVFMKHLRLNKVMDGH